MLAIITRGLYILSLFFEGQKVYLGFFFNFVIAALSFEFKIQIFLELQTKNRESFYGLKTKACIF